MRIIISKRYVIEIYTNVQLFSQTFQYCSVYLIDLSISIDTYERSNRIYFRLFVQLLSI